MIDTVTLRIADPVTFQIIRHRMDNIIDEAIIALKNVSASPITTEGHDLMVSLFTTDGELMLGGVGFLHHLTSAAQSVKHLIGYLGEDPGIFEDDVFFFNDSYTGALHPPDVYIISPIHYEGVLRGFVANFVHMTDIGAMSPGGFVPEAKDTYAEGFQTKGLKIVERGKPRRDVIDTILNQVRDPDMSLMDMKSQMAANHVAKTRLQDLFAEYGVDVVEQVSKQLISQSESLMRERLRSLPDGCWWVRQYVDTDHGAYRVVLKATKEDDRLLYDFTGSDLQAPIGINCSYWATVGGLFAPLFPLLAWDITWNEGVTRPVEVIAPEGTVVNCTRPAPLSIATVSMINTVNNLSTVVLSKMLGASEQYNDRASAIWYGAHASVTTFGRKEDGSWFTASLTDAFTGSGGASAVKDGVDLGGELPNPLSRWANVEHHELRTPLIYLFRRAVPDSGGPGKFRGGLSHEFGFIPHGAGGNPMGLVRFGKGSKVPMSYGIFGGYPGCNTGYSTFGSANVDEWPRELAAIRSETREDNQWGTVELLPGDMQYMRLPAGGGYGDPLDRAPEVLVTDIEEGKVSTTCATEIYGVVFVQAGTVDDAATARRRAELRASRLGIDVAQLRPHVEVPRTRFRLSECLQKTDAGETQCTACGLVIAPKESHWKEQAVERRSPTSIAGPARESADEFSLLESFCPGCATVLDVEVTNGQDSALHDEIWKWPSS
jgi:N-methylhydantoinase B